MKTLHKIVVITFLLTGSCIADEVYFYDGRILKNCIVTPLGRQVKVVTNEKIVHLNQNPTFVQNVYYFSVYEVYRIVYASIDSSQETQIENGKEIPISEEQQIPKKNAHAVAESHFPNMKLLPLSIVSFGLAWDYLADASEIQTANNEFAVSQKDRKRAIGISLIVVGVINTIIAFDRVEIIADKNSVGFSYAF